MELGARWLSCCFELNEAVVAVLRRSGMWWRVTEIWWVWCRFRWWCIEARWKEEKLGGFDLESLVSDVPIVACPLWNDQLCNAKLIQDVLKIGVRVSVNDEGIVEKDDLGRCIDVVMKGEDYRKNAKK
uniref:Glucosyl transferase n=1 Tax=Solanum tuberosum TaxID=4113 RepID=M1D1S0_SOLTU